MLAFVSKFLGAIPMSAGDGDVIAQTVIEQRLAKFGEIILPAEIVRNLDRVDEGRRVHQFEVLLVLRGGAGGNFVEPFAGVARIDDLEFCERVEEMIVAAHTGGRNERAHRERVHQRIVEMLIFKRARNRGIAFAADGLRGDAARHRVGLEEGESIEIDAQFVVGAIANPRLRVHGARQMTMKVGAFGHAHEKVAQFERILADGVERASSALFCDRAGSDCRSWAGLSSRCLCEGRGRDEEKEDRKDSILIENISKR